MKKLAPLLMSVIFLLLSFPVNAQSTKIPVGNEVYKIYKEKGIDKAIDAYHQLKKQHPDEYVFNQFELNNTGYRIIEDDEQLEDAKKILWLNIQEYPMAANPYDSYADVLAKLGQKNEAIKYYQKAIDTYEKVGRFEQNVIESSKAKLAVLTNSHKVLDFWVGEWNVENTTWTDEGAERKGHGELSVRYINNLVLVFNLMYPTHKDIPGAVFFISYNAETDDYDYSFVSPLMQGTITSHMKLEKAGDKYIFFEEHRDSGISRVIRHELQPSGDEIIWSTYEAVNGGEFKRFFRKNLTRK